MIGELNSLILKINGPTQLMIEDPIGRRYGIHPIWLRERCAGDLVARSAA